MVIGVNWSCENVLAPSYSQRPSHTSSYCRRNDDQNDAKQDPEIPSPQPQYCARRSLCAMSNFIRPVLVWNVLFLLTHNLRRMMISSMHDLRCIRHGISFIVHVGRGNHVGYSRTKEFNPHKASIVNPRNPPKRSRKSTITKIPGHPSQYMQSTPRQQTLQPISPFRPPTSHAFPAHPPTQQSACFQFAVFGRVVLLRPITRARSII